jgi:hypothetical protein
MSIDLDKIQEMWEKDAKIDPDNLHTESLNIPVLHAKYFDLYNTIFLLRKKAEQQKANVRHGSDLHFLRLLLPAAYFHAHDQFWPSLKLAKITSTALASAQAR